MHRTGNRLVPRSWCVRRRVVSSYGYGSASLETTGPFTCRSPSFVFCWSTQGPDSTRGEAEVQAWWRRSAAPIRPSWHRMDFVEIRVKQAEVESSVPWRLTMRCLLWSWSYHRRRLVTKVHIDASRAALRRLGVREQIELFWSLAPPVPSGFSVDEHADLLTKAARVALTRAAPRRQADPQADWINDKAWQAVRTDAAARRVHQKASWFLSWAWLRSGRFGQALSADCVVSLWIGGSE